MQRKAIRRSILPRQLEADEENDMSTQGEHHQTGDLPSQRTRQDMATDDDVITAAEQQQRLVVAIKGMLVLLCALVGVLGIQGIAPERVASDATGLASLLESFQHALLWSSIGAVIGILAGVLLARLVTVQK